MTDYISREAAIALAKDIVIPTKDGCDYRHRCIDPQDITELPAANVVEVVRCADCRCFQINMRKDDYLLVGVPECECRWWCGEVSPTDYCSHAKCKNEEQDGDRE